MRASPQIVVTGVSAVSAVGLNVEQTCASIRAGIQRFQEHPYYSSKLPDPPLSKAEAAIISPVVPSSPRTVLPERLMELALRPMKDLIAKAKLKRSDFQATAVLVSLPSQDRTVKFSGYEKGFSEEYLRRLAIESGQIQMVFQAGHVGVFCALEEAVKILSARSSGFCIVVGVDSYVDYESIQWLDEHYRLKSLRNVDGFVPGESAALFLLETHDQAVQRNSPVLAVLKSVSQTSEPNSFLSKKASTGQGLTQAIRQLDPDDSHHSYQWTICDLNGESYRSQEWGVALCRAAKSLDNLKSVWHPANCIGDVGAATGALSIAMACRAFTKGYAPASEVLLWASSDHGPRAACSLAAPH